MINIIKFSTIDSTNSYAKNHIYELKDRDVITADSQEKGRGRFSRTWISRNPDNLYCTIVLKPSEIPRDYPIATVSHYLAYVIADYIDRYLLVSRITTTIKWPNDVRIKGKKIAGILPESVIQGDVLKGIVLGFGINLNMSLHELDAIDQPATSLNHWIGSDIDKNEFFNGLLDEFFKNYEEFVNKGFEIIRKLYTIKADFLGQVISIKTVDSIVQGCASEIDSNGNLILKLTDGSFKTMTIGEIV
ncbi:biotin--[acetyl-CoA-carboxylase] ligase [Thermoproteota archaeon]